MSPSRIPASASARPLRARDAARRDTGFTVEEAGEASSPIAAGAAPLGASTLLAVQAGADRPAGHAQGAPAGATPAQRAALDGLKDLQLALLRGGGVPAAELARLAGLAERLAAEGADAAPLGRALSLRLRVELARRDPPHGA